MQRVWGHIQDQDKEPITPNYSYDPDNGFGFGFLNPENRALAAVELYKMNGKVPTREQIDAYLESDISIRRDIGEYLHQERWLKGQK